MAVVEALKGTVRVRVSTDPVTGISQWITLNAQSRTGNNVFIAWNDADMLNFTPVYADLCVREDRDTLFVYSNLTPPAAPPTVLSDWRQVSWTDAEHVADEAAMLALSNLDKGDLVYRDDTSELYIKEYDPSSLLTSWMKIGSRPDTWIAATEAEMLALVAEKGDLAIRTDLGATFSLQSNPASILTNWVKLPGGGTTATWLRTGAASTGMDPGLGNFTAVSDLLSPATWTFEISAVDTTATVHNFSILKPGDTLIFADVPSVGAPTFSQRFSLLSEPQVRGPWFVLVAEADDVALGLEPPVGSELALEVGFGGGGGKSLDELSDVQTLTDPRNPTLTVPGHGPPNFSGPVQGETLVFDAASGLWYPSPDPHVVYESVDEPLMPDGTAVPDGTLWLNPTEPPLPIKVIEWLDDLLDVDTVTVPPLHDYVLTFNQTVGQWMPKKGLTVRTTWVYFANTTVGIDPGVGAFTASSDYGMPATWTFEISATDTNEIVHNFSILKIGDTLVFADVPATGAPLSAQRYILLTEPVDNGGWYTFTAEPFDVPIGVLPGLGTEMEIEYGFGGAGVRKLDELEDVQTIGLTTHPAGPAPGDVLKFDPDGGGPGIPLWIPGPDPHVVFTPVPITAEEPTLPDGSRVPDGTIWISPGELPPGPTSTYYLPLAGGTLTGELVFQDDLEGITFGGGSRIYGSGADVALGSNFIMGPAGVIQFPNEAAPTPKINLFSNTFGLGVESGTTTLYSGSRVRFRIGTPTDATIGGITSPEVASVDANGYIHNGVWVPTLKVINNVSLVVGHWYEISTVDYHRTVRFRIGTIGPGKPTRAQSLDGLAGLLADAGEGVSTYEGYMAIYGHVKGSQTNSKLFDTLGVGPSKLWIKCRQACTGVQVGIEAYDTASGARTTLSFADAGTSVNTYQTVAL